jgi:hypothetical protein
VIGREGEYSVKLRGVIGRDVGIFCFVKAKGKQKESKTSESIFACFRFFSLAFVSLVEGHGWTRGGIFRQARGRIGWAFCFVLLSESRTKAKRVNLTCFAFVFPSVAFFSHLSLSFAFSCFCFPYSCFRFPSLAFA